MKYEELYEELVAKMNKYHPNARLGVIEAAYKLSFEAHDGQVRKSGEPYIVHPLWVAIILAELRLDTETIVAALLHDVAEDTELSIEDIAERFGTEVAELVDGVTKLQKIQYTSKTDAQAENYRKMFFAMSKDIRIIIIKIADRLHNMRTLEHQPEHKQKEIAQETLEIYAPLAHKLGISRIRYELEDLGFKYLESETYRELAHKIGLKQQERQKLVDAVVGEIQAKLDQGEFTAEVSGRPKHFFSVYKKMRTKEKQLDEIYDLHAVRVLVENAYDCYQVLGVLHDMYTPLPGRVKDYIAIAKPNNYRSLHTTILKNGEPFEVQIRTHEMHKVAEYGIAAHWRYKTGQEGENSETRAEDKLQWLGRLLEWQRELSDNEEYIDAVKFDLSIFQKNVYCFSPKGDVVSLPSGATVIDFAYMIHSAVGNHMVAAKVNGIAVSFEYELKTGDRVDILTSQNQQPNQDWLKLVKTTQARTKINQWFKKQNRSDNIIRGREILTNAAKNVNVPLEELLAEKRIDIVLHRFNFKDYDTLCAAVGHGGLKENQVINRLFEAYKEVQPVVVEELVEELLKAGAKESNKRHTKSGITVHGVGDTNVRFSKCCSPLPGDEVVGFVTRGRGVTVHRTDCVNIVNLDEINRRRMIEVAWSTDTAERRIYRADLRIKCMDKDGMLLEITKILSDEGMNLKALNARLDHGDVLMDLGIEVSNLTQLNRLQSRLKNHPGVHEIIRTTA